MDLAFTHARNDAWGDPLPNLLMANSILLGKQWLFVLIKHETSTLFPSCSLSSLALISYNCCRLKSARGNEGWLIVLISGTFWKPSISVGGHHDYVRVSLKVTDAAWLQWFHDLGPYRQKHGNKNNSSSGRKGPKCMGHLYFSVVFVCHNWKPDLRRWTSKTCHNCINN